MFITYADENNDYFIPASYSFLSGSGPKWVEIVESYFNITNYQLTKYMFCPHRKTINSVTNAPGNKNYPGYAVLTYGPCRIAVAGYGTSGHPFKTVKVPNLSQAILLSDVTYYHSNGQYAGTGYYLLDNQSASSGIGTTSGTGNLTGIHNKADNMAFCDGHVELITTKISHWWLKDEWKAERGDIKSRELGKLERP
jgi:prepilin-type processing-associated H-X9-DG protein